MRPLSQRARAIVTTIAAALALIGVTVTAGLVIDTDDGGKPRGTVTIIVGAADDKAPTPAPPDAVPHGRVAGPIGDKSEPLSPPAVVDADNAVDPGQAAKQGNPAAGVDTHEDARDETPPGVSAEEAEDLADDVGAGKTAPKPVGGAQNHSCRYRPVVNQSSRGGARVSLAVLHYTVSSNRPGWSDVNAIWGLFNTRSFGASSTYIMDFEGHCLRLMSEGAKPWTQGAFNPVSVSIELIATGRESRSDWLAAPLIRDGILASLWRDVLRRHGLPIRRVDPIGCGVQRAGWTDHESLECSNNHTDVRPAFPYDVFGKQLRAGGVPKGRAVLLAGEKRNVDCLQAERRSAKRHGGWDKIAPSHLRRASSCKDNLRRSVAFYRAHPTPKKAVRAERRRYIAKIIG